MLALVLALWSASALAQSITVSPALIEADAGGYDNILSVDFGGYDVSGYYTSVQFYGADAVTPVGSGVYSWLGAYFYQGEFNCSFGNNPGIARTAYFKVMLRDGNNYSHVVDSSNLVTVVQAGADCPAPDHLALTEGSITPHGGSFTWTGYTNEYWLNFELLTGMDNDMVSDDDQYGRILTANFDEDNIPSTLYFNGDYLGYFANRGFDWNGNEGVITYLHPIGCIQTYGTTGELELYMTSKSYPTIISFQAMLAAGVNTEASFWIDGIKVLEITSSEFQTKDWTQYSFELSPYYDHTLEWKFAKSDNDCVRFVRVAGAGAKTERALDTISTALQKCHFDRLLRPFRCCGEGNLLISLAGLVVPVIQRGGTFLRLPPECQRARTPDRGRHLPIFSVAFVYQPCLGDTRRGSVPAVYDSPGARAGVYIFPHEI